MMKQTFIKLHISILLAGLTGIFGKLISLNEGLLVWYRMMFAGILFFLFLLFTKKLEKINVYNFLKIAGVGCLLGLHWVFFYGSIKASNISIGVVCFSMVSFFSAILEPIILRRRFALREFSYSLLALAGVFLIFSFDIRYRTGILLGILSSAFCALFTILTKQIGVSYSSRTIFLHEMIGGCLLITCLLPFYLHYFPVESIFPDKQDFIYLLLLAVFCTIGLQLLQIQVLQRISAFTVNLTYNLEPVYSIVLAMLFFGEAKELHFSFYLGITFIILSVLLQARKTLQNQ